MRFRWLVIAAWVAIAIWRPRPALPSLGSEVNNDNTQFLPNSAPSNEAATLAAPLIGSASKQSQIIIVAALVEQKPPAAAPRFLSAADLSVINAQAVAARSLPHVVSSEVVGISPDRQAARILVTTDVGLNNIVGQEPVVNTLQAKLGSADRARWAPSSACSSTWRGRWPPMSPTRPAPTRPATKSSCSRSFSSSSSCW